MIRTERPILFCFASRGKEIYNTFEQRKGDTSYRDRCNIKPEMHGLANIPLYTNNIEMKAAAQERCWWFSTVNGQEGLCPSRLPSGEVRMIMMNCKATIGQLSNIENENISIGKAGRKRWMGIRPTVRGSAMNPVDHPHGGGEGKSPVGKPGPMTPWGKPTLGYKTRMKNKKSSDYIVKKRK